MIGTDPTSRSGADSSRSPTGEAICLFAFAKAENAPAPPKANEAFEQRILTHRVGPIIALAGVVRIDDYCGADAERRLSDVAWVAPRVRRHAELIEWATQWSPVFPAPFGALYSNIDSLTAFVCTHEERIVNFLRAVADKQEWELKAVTNFASPEVLDELARNAWPEWSALSKGARYMRLCRDRPALLEYGREQAEEVARECVTQLRPLLADLRELSLRHASQGSETVTRCALLVPKPNVDSLRARVEELSAAALRRRVAIYLSGPWPPFSFRPSLDT